MTIEELYLKKVLDEANVDVLCLTEGQREAKIEDAERHRYGRYWIWDSYFNEKNRQLWLETADALKHINDQVLEDIQDYIMLEAFKGMNETQISQLIEFDQQERITNHKKLMKKNQDEYFK